MQLLSLLEESPIIAAVKEKEGLERCFKTDCQVIFVLFGTICDITEITARIKEQGRTAIIHADLIAGLGAKEVAVQFIRESTRADGIISTKPALLKHARELGLFAIQRSFLVDSLALAGLKKQLDAFKPDAVEIMPGVMPKILKTVREYTGIPLIASGLLSDKRDVLAAFDAGADAVSMTKEELWYI
ncbi:MAG: glycerol-3-phosphate responsive antiterminator [Lachnospiraceae bacterium]|nr:glycerol-3-phosphate responsive antiterminator [Lachnospiraceae bacterium]